MWVPALKQAVYRNLHGVGNKMREWLDVTDKAVHLRRRLTFAEQAHTGDAIDVRNTEEAMRRLDNVRPYLIGDQLDFAIAEIAGNL